MQELVHLTEGQKINLLNEFDTLNNSFDILLIDTGAGISSNVIYFNLAAQERIVIVTAEPTSITDACIPDKRFRNRDPRFRGEQKHKCRNVDRFTLADFQHNEVSDAYLCPNGKLLRLNVKKAVMDGVIYRRYVADRDDCMGCKRKVKCTRHKTAKRKFINVPVGSVPGNVIKAMAAKVDSEKGRKIYPQRIAIVEPVFANIRTHKEMNRSTLRGKIMVNIQWLLYCMVHNIGKLVSYSFA